MIFKIHTSKNTMECFSEITAAEGYQPFILSKLAIALSVKCETPLSDQDFCTDVSGLELNRQTITGDYDALFKCLIEMFEGKHLGEDEYLQKYLKAHIDRGAKLLYSEYKYQNDFITALLCDLEGL